MRRKIKINLPFNDLEAIRALHIGDEVILSGPIITGRDAFHKKLSKMSRAPDFLTPGSAIYHCGPIAKFAKNKKIELLAAGPTTSWRMGLYAPDIIKRFSIRIFIGKGGMGNIFPETCREYGALYLSFPGGCAQSACKYITEVVNCHYLKEFGPAEAVYEIIVKDFPLIVSIDSHGGNIHESVRMKSLREAGR